jgi:hypothetical protein
LHVENPLLLSVIDSLGSNELLSISIGHTKTGRGYFRVMRLGNRHIKTYVTRRAGEEWDPTCIVERYWGSINAARYREKIVPIVEGWLRLNRNAGNELIFMQDSASAHAAALIMKDLRE